jgi:hypothetical protein
VLRVVMSGWFCARSDKGADWLWAFGGVGCSLVLVLLFCPRADAGQDPNFEQEHKKHFVVNLQQ